MKKILIVDDEADIVGLLTEFLSSEGYNTECAYDGEEAIVKSKVFKPDLVLLDLKMPNMNGYEVCKAIRKESECIIVIVNGYIGEIVGIEDALHAGVNDFFTKPIDLQKILTRVNLFLKEDEK